MQTMRNISLPQFAWYNPRMVNFPLPDNLYIEFDNIKGYNKRSLTLNETESPSVSTLWGVVFFGEKISSGFG